MHAGRLWFYEHGDGCARHQDDHNAPGRIAWVLDKLVESSSDGDGAPQLRLASHMQLKASEVLGISLSWGREHGVPVCDAVLDADMTAIKRGIAQTHKDGLAIRYC